MTTLVDTSAWLDHFRGTGPDLSPLLERGEVLLHPWVLGEIALGSLGARRGKVLADLALLPVAPLVDDADVLALIETHRLGGRGIGWVDAQLLASTLLAGAVLWTSDRVLVAVARERGVSHKP